MKELFELIATYPWISLLLAIGAILVLQLVCTTILNIVIVIKHKDNATGTIQTGDNINNHS